MTSVRVGTALMVVLTIVLAASSRACVGPQAVVADQPAMISVAAQTSTGAAYGAADTALAAWDASLAASASAGRDGGTATLGGGDEPQAIDVSGVGRPGPSIPAARWVWALLVLGVVAVVLLTAVADGLTSPRQDRTSVASGRPRRGAPAA